MFLFRSRMDEMTIADLANALRGIPRDALVLIGTPDGPKRLRMVVGTHVGERGQDRAAAPSPSGMRPSCKRRGDQSRKARAFSVHCETEQFP